MSSEQGTVLVFIRTLLKGGAEKQSILLAQALHKEVPVILTVLHGEQIAPDNLLMLQESGIRVHYCHGNVFQKIWSFIKLIREERVWLILSFLFSNNIIAGVIGRVFGVSKTVGGIRSQSQPYWKFYPQRFLHNHINEFTVFNNNAGAENLRNRGFREEKIRVIPNMVEMPGAFIRKQTNEVQILSIGRFIAAKDYFTALNLVKELAAENAAVNLKYQIIGYGPLEENIRAYIRSNNMQSIVSVIINPKDVMQYYKKADIYLSTSIREGLSNTILEAMAHALPVVVTDAGDNSYLIEHGKNGFIHPIGDKDGLKGSLTGLIQSKIVRIETGERACHTVEQKYSSEAFLRHYRGLLNELRQ